ncbi:WD40 repeat protein [Allofrancisella inopinata]|uniref:WD40 repeat domain-containing protein n=1 Tax=Allofrancisella inopinata TaxID=1085647 RepID=A0AAE6YJX3_9GAMM|nr:WD40 repeat domain-containing protein [Allofrancisella inopinata]QIV96139.1 WD40 repeat domain-containing protein [Allofrancisella inopinata]TDT72053.1 WD40 repeat protein [Allofrancisella inopinata]
MTDEEFDIYWYRTISIVVTMLSNYEPSQPIDEAYKEKTTTEIYSLLYKDPAYEGVSNPSIAITKVSDLLKTIKNLKNNEIVDQELEEIHSKIKSELKRLYTVYVHRLNRTQLINCAGVPSSDLVDEINSKKSLFIPKQLLPLICEYLDSSSYRTFRIICKLSSKVLPPLPLLPINEQNPIILTGHYNSITSLLALPDGRIVSGSVDGTIRVWNLNDPTNPIILTGHNNRIITSLLALPDGRIVSGSADGTIRIWNLNSPTNPTILTGHEDWLRKLILLPDGMIGSLSEASTIRIWDLNSPIRPTNSIMLMEHKPWVWVSEIILLPDGRIGGVSGSKTIRVWNLNDPTNPIILSGHGHWITALTSLPDGRVVSGSEESNIGVWDLNDPTNPVILGRQGGRVTVLTSLLDERIVSGSVDGTIRVWDLNDPTNPIILSGHGHWITALTSLPDGRIISGSRDRTIRIW